MEDEKRGPETTENGGSHEGDERREIQWRPSVVVLGPGFIGGFAHLGALSILEDFLQDVNIWCGVSVGSILALLLTCGYRASEIMTVILGTEIMRDLCGIRVSSAPVSIESVYKKLVELVTSKLGEVPTMSMLRIKTGKSYMTAALNVDTEKVEYFTPQSTPDISCVVATLLAIGDALLYRRQRYGNSQYVSSLFGDPYPVALVDNGERNILCIYLRSLTEIVDTSNPLMTVYRRVRVDELGPSAYFSRILQTSIDHHVDLIIERHRNPRVQHLQIGTYHLYFTPETVTPLIKSELIDDGQAAARLFLKTLQGPETERQ